MAASRFQLCSWGLYDWAHSAFATNIQTFLFAAYFTRSIAANEKIGTELWGLMLGASGLLIAAGGPILGAAADQTGVRKPWIAAFTAIAAAAIALLWFVTPAHSSTWRALLLVGLGTLATEYASIFYNSMLPHLTSSKNVGGWSGYGWAFGYAGGLGSLVTALLLFVDPGWLHISHQAAENVRASFIMTAMWFLVFSFPLFLFVPDEESHGKSFRAAALGGWRQVIESIYHVRRYADLVHFLIARMIYIDALATMFALGGVFAAGAFKMTAQQVLLFGITLNVTAGAGAAVFGWIDDRIGSKKTIAIALIGLIVPISLMLFVRSIHLFWALGLIMGIFVGPAQTASRSYIARSAPEDLQNEMFGLFALSGKATAFLGPALVSLLTRISGSQRVGMSVIAFLLLIGLLLMRGVPEAKRADSDP
jgi:MFS transporter, UMF1 family